MYVKGVGKLPAALGLAGDAELILSSEDEHMDHPTQMRARLKGWIRGKRGIDERQDGCAEQGGKMKEWMME